jgi:hypothetical protein
VITLLRSTVTVTPADAGTEELVKVVGTVKFLGCQSSIKKPMVLASAGSTCGFTVVVSPVGGGADPPFFLQEIIMGRTAISRQL